MSGTIVIPAEHLTIRATGAEQVISADNATNETTILYTVATARIAYLTDVLISIKSTSLDFEQVTLRFTDDSASTNYDWVINVSPYDTLTINLPFKRAIKMDEDDTLNIISPDANVLVNATANILLT
jgi:hypothetical protein